jgi:hypothetical protein
MNFASRSYFKLLPLRDISLRGVFQYCTCVTTPSVYHLSLSLFHVSRVFALLLHLYNLSDPYNFSYKKDTFLS